MVVDGRGRAYVGNLGFDLFSGSAEKPAELVLVDRDGSARIVATGLGFPNGSVITPDYNTFRVRHCENSDESLITLPSFCPNRQPPASRRNRLKIDYFF